MSFFKEFKEFAVKGNVIDLAVGVIVGGAFGKIVSSLVDDVIMPIISSILGDVDFSSYAFVLKQAEGGEAAVILKYGAFIQSVVYFVLMSLIIFIMVKMINKIRREPDKEVAAPTQEELLTEIRDLLRK